MRLLLILLLPLAACGSAKTAFIDTKYSLCKDSCRLKYSAYESQKLNKCLSSCSQDKYDHNKK